MKSSYVGVTPAMTTLVIASVLLSSCVVPALTSVVCPDGESECPDGYTCCLMDNEKYGCCPLPNAVCCSDHTHCCPNNYKCNVSAGSCYQETGADNTLTNIPASVIQKATLVKCNNTIACPDKETCCKYPSGFKCCPHPQGVCCTDGKNCCPSGWECLATGKCSRDNSVIPSTALNKPQETFPVRIANKMSDNAVKCPDGQSECPDGNTCCKLASGQYGCCPLPKAVCCNDHIHCCPNGYTCDVSSGACNRGDSTIPYVKKLPSKPMKQEVDSVVCPGGSAECPDGNTCCKLRSGKYGCCPLPNAVCCSDKIHCCPNGYTCDGSPGGCRRKDSFIPCVKKLPSKPIKKEVGSVVCPGGTSECPDGNTCCRLAFGEYGCCPLPKAVCCNDHIHCCPNGYTCDVSSGACNRGDSTIPYVKKLPSKPIKKDVCNVVCPGGTAECPNGNTCCKLASGQYGCCPLPKAVCCSDHIHCCPNGYTCDVSSGACHRGLSSIPFIKKLPSKPIKKEVGSVVCPGGSAECPNGNTCCKLASGQYGCCPLPKAVCCNDHIHCCPNGYTCDVSSGACHRGLSSIPFIKKLPSKPIKKEVGSVVCPGGSAECPNGNTCCKLASGQYGCCPLPKAVCCSDHIHCCPNGYTCDVSSGACHRGDSTIPYVKKLPSKPIKKDVSNVVCPGGTAECPNGNTCCKLASGQYGCCPLPKAVCCSDHIHCCPNGYTCDVSSGACHRGLSSIPFIKKLPSKPIKKEVGSVVCPGGTAECPNGNTCCKLASGQYGCCPLPKAVCCNDHIHCCPNGYTCDVSSGACNRGDSTIPYVKKLPSKPMKQEVDSVVCPGGSAECPDGNTCCKLRSGKYGCCPLPNAVCCSDKIHCCPNGYTCDGSPGGCRRKDSFIPCVKKLPSKPIKKEVGSVVCPGGTSECPDGNTCCRLASGEYGCCPLPKAVCCNDHIHCCPNGYTCDVSSGACNRGDSTIPYVKKLPSKPIKKDVCNVVCPGGTAECPNGNTCCKLASGQYGCCPLPKAVCCSDHIHCCPNGYTCDVSSGACHRGLSSIPFIKKLPSKPIKKEVGSVVCPGGSAECPNGNTCCKLASGQYGCCPLPKAVCCNDHIHCCPNGYTCDVSSGACHRGLSSIPFIKKLPSKPIKKEVGSVVCPGGSAECPNGNTCCKLASGQYGCCPLPKAVCCSDHIHCCPNGYTCDVSSGACHRGDSTIPYVKKLPSKPIKKDVSNVVCPGGTAECPNGNTCCKLASGQYGCCPLPKAVCCSDHIHCCPNGYTCDVSSGACHRGLSSIPFIKKLPSKPIKKEVGSVVCPGGTAECPNGNTCCKLASGQYGCCPLPKAVCCNDHIHCCPNGYTCDVSSGACNRGDSTIPYVKKLPSKPIKKDVGNVVCPGGSAECPNRNTCCKLASGQYGCCPLPKAVCCSDHIHCCPNGYTCDVSSGACHRGLSSIPFIKKQPSKPIKQEVGSVVCPGGTAECPDGNTCCKLASGQYGCCPLPKAVCCNDHIHCCPNGYTCDVSSGACKRGDSTIPYVKKLPSKPIQKEVGSVVCPGGTAECPDGNTCCRLASGQYGCCPLPKAVCCSDHIHCCPNGYTCDVSSGACNRGDSTIPYVKKLPSKPIKKDVGNVVCPGGSAKCPNGNTCCKLASGQYGCCPLPKAVCCSDHIHCCPNGYTCDVSSGACHRGLSSIPFIKKQPSKPIKQEVGSVVCPGGTAECPDGNTCCKLASGQYGCCPLPKAVCCNDHIHCCPNGYTCDVSSGACKRGDSTIPYVKKLPSKPIKKEVGSVVCPGGTAECPDGNTCCRLASGQYGCCPLPKAVCCNDHIHCCPNGYTCDVSSGACNRGDSTIPYVKKLPSKPIKKDVGNVVCPGGTSECPDGNTCCRLASGQYGCCPLPKAVCCNDHIHCCPNGYTCDVSSGACHRGLSSIPFIKKLPSKPIKKEVGSVVCPGGSAECPNGNTCCKLASGQYGCCPLPKAVSCNDHIHCCPNGYTCDVSSGACNRGDSTIPYVKKLPSKPIKEEVGSVVCPDGTSECPDGNTCCKLASGQYGCCPLPKAVCCNDHIHCCPNGYTCDVSSGACNRGDSTIPYVKKLPSKPIKKDVGNVVCPGGSAECPNGNTCCKLASGQYGCCPLSKAVCCSDHIHCCPNGYTCDVSSGACHRGLSSIPFIKKQPSKPIKQEVGSVVCPGGTAECPDGNTCCKLASGQYGCCPLPKAVCCNDHIHCCPNGYTCDVSSGACKRGDSTIPYVKKLPSKPIKKEVGSVVCPGGTAECPDGNTCCRLASGQYGCCPLPKAVCCNDHIHCCPNGYTCDVSSGACNRGDSTIPYVKKLPSKPIKKDVGNVVCPGGTSECPDGNTCCRLASGQYGCCPLPKAVCCNDHIHCCPNGYTCDVSSGACHRGLSSIPFIKKLPSKPIKKEVGSVVCPGGSAECPNGNTCCKLASGQYGCCPLPKAVSCNDHIHCCPNGYTCDVSSGACNRGDSTIPYVKKLPSKPIKEEVGSVVCPDGTSECPDGNTCCKLASGQYGCCPLPKAVCCNDHIHCCPNGYTCDVSSGACNRGDSTIPYVKKLPSKPIKKDVGNVVCPGGSAECPNGNTCCKLASGQYGCCPLSKAVCCSDHIHCCPNGYTCDVSSGACHRGLSSIPFIKKLPSKPIKKEVGSVVCPGGTAECPNGNTCCKLASGQYGCCPLPKAVCCNDHIHCCPNGYTCDVSSGACSRGDSTIPYVKKLPSKPIKEEVGSVVCPDGTSECPDGNTCCKLASGQYGCCPLPKAVCCNDHIHCCPNGYTCDVLSGACHRGLSSIPFIKKLPSKPIKKEVGSVVCPGGTAECPNGNTCCKLASGQYGCCPLPKAVCCNDHIHCCPNGYTCDVSSGACHRGLSSIPFIKKLPSKPIKKEVGSVVCPGGSAECPNGNTCCKLASGQYGCCPLPKAVCCNDHIHCCPNGYTCDVWSGACHRGLSSIPFIKKLPSKPIKKEVGSVVCPGGSAECPNGNTCCKLASGQYGCCPLPKAVCCSDHIHCCPNGYTCDVSSGACHRGLSSIPFIKKLPSKPIMKEVGSVVCPGGSAECPNGNTCCKLASGQYGCCPLPKAVCCSDHIHCCPNGYTCDVSSGACKRGDSTIPYVKKLPSKHIKKEVGNVVCPDGTSECPDGNTCCRLASGEYGCCPLPKAVCCNDHIHCCPNGYTCDVSRGACKRGDSTIPYVKKLPSKPIKKDVGNVVCPGGTSECPDGNTCCKLASGQYGCCPLPKAVCCNDHIHCCPNGYTCDVSSGACNRGDLSIPFVKKESSKKITEINKNPGVNNINCTDGSQCLDYETCCLISSESYGCCPLPNAVCCSDHEHCCPCGYNCDTSSHTCYASAKTVPMIPHRTSSRRLSGNGVVDCPDGSTCNSGETCCEGESGKYGCCPLPSAVCCPDKKHCCPSGFNCDVKKQKCVRGNSIIPMLSKRFSKKTAVHMTVLPVTVPKTPTVTDDVIRFVPKRLRGDCHCGLYQTCCVGSEGEQHCCPLPNASCCADGLHCCPQGFTCDSTKGCIKN